jgi:hypothetical protein
MRRVFREAPAKSCCLVWHFTEYVWFEAIKDIYTALGIEFNKRGFGFITNASNSQAQGIEAVSFCPFWAGGQKIQGTSGST